MRYWFAKTISGDEFLIPESSVSAIKRSAQDIASKTDGCVFWLASKEVVACKEAWLWSENDEEVEMVLALWNGFKDGDDVEQEQRDNYDRDCS